MTCIRLLILGKLFKHITHYTEACLDILIWNLNHLSFIMIVSLDTVMLARWHRKVGKANQENMNNKNNNPLKRNIRETDATTCFHNTSIWKTKHQILSHPTFCTYIWNSKYNPSLSQQYLVCKITNLKTAQIHVIQVDMAICNFSSWYFLH